MTIQKENMTYERTHDACRICGVDADCMAMDQELSARYEFDFEP